MAKTSNLREFQEAILQKLKEATAQGAAQSNSRLGVMAVSYTHLDVYKRQF